MTSLVHYIVGFFFFLFIVEESMLRNVVVVHMHLRHSSRWQIALAPAMPLCCPQHIGWFCWPTSTISTGFRILIWVTTHHFSVMSSLESITHMRVVFAFMSFSYCSHCLDLLSVGTVMVCPSSLDNYSASHSSSGVYFSSLTWLDAPWLFSHGNTGLPV